MDVPHIEINQKIVDALEQEMLLNISKAHGSVEAWRTAKLWLRRKNYRFNKGQRITVHFNNGPKDYIFEKIDWDWSNELEPIIFARAILRNGKKSSISVIALRGSILGVRWDSPCVTLSTNSAKIK